jgi:hypothetical protein
MVTAVLAAALCSVVQVLTGASPAAAWTLPIGGGTGLPGVPLTLVAGVTALPTGLAVADLSQGASGPVTLMIGPCLGGPGKSCPGVLSEFWLLGNFKDAAGNPLYSDTAPASVSWTCNALVCPPPASFVPGSSTRTELQVAEFLDHTIYFAPRNPDGTFQAFEPAPACQGIDEAPLPTGMIDQADTGGLEFCVDVGAISRADAQCPTVCSTWAGPLTMPVLFVEDPKFMGT